MGMNVGGRHFTTGDVVLGIALLIGLISVFMPWYSASVNCSGLRFCVSTSDSVGGLAYWAGWLFFIAVLAGIVLYVFRTFVPNITLPALPQTDAMIYLILGALMLLMAILWLFLGSGGANAINYSGPGYSVSSGPSFGLFVGIVAGAGVIVGGYLKRADAQVAPHHGAGFGGGATAPVTTSTAAPTVPPPATPPPPAAPSTRGTTPPPPATP